MWDNFLKFLNDNKDALDFLLGPGIIIVVLGAIYTTARWLIKEYRLRRIRTNDNFPFKIILPNSNVAKEILGGADNDPLADRNIPYQQRVQGRNTRRELEELIEDNRWILITGRTGLGKTREAVQVAQTLNNEGWTILHLTREAWLDAPAKLPNNVPERKLLFFLDDLNKKCHSSKAEIRPDANESLTLPIYEPFQARLQRTLATFDTFCGKSEIKVIITARNEKTSEFDEPSEWDKLGWEKYNSLWEKFKLVDLPEPDKVAEQELLAETAIKAEILIKSDELPNLAKRNDGTFRNLVENLSYARTEGFVLSPENFRDTLRGTWRKRYQKALQKYPEAKCIYDAVELLQDINVSISFFKVIQVAEIISSKKFLEYIQSKWKYFFTLRQLIKSENILNPRDGQIEAKEYHIDAEKYLPFLYKQVFISRVMQLITKSGFFRKIYIGIAGFGIINLYLAPKSIFLPSKKLSYLEKIYCSLLGLQVYLNFLGNHYSSAGFRLYAEHLFQKSLEIQNALSRMGRRYNSLTWFNLGGSYLASDRTEDALQAFQKAIEIDPKDSNSWYRLGNIYRDLGRNDEAINAYQKNIELEPKSDSPWYSLGKLYTITKEYDKAIFSCQKAIQLSPNNGRNHSSLVGILRRLGRENEATDQENLTRSLINKENEVSRARFEAICKNNEKALRLLKIALEKKQISLQAAKLDPDFDFIRDDPRFKKIIGLEE